MKTSRHPVQGFLRRWGLLLALLLLLLSGLVVFDLVNSVDRVASRELQKVLEDAFHVPVNIGAMVVHVRRGMGEVDHVTLNNPEGYDEPVALRIEHADGFVRVPSAHQRLVEIHDLVVLKPEFTVEHAGGQFNWTALIHRLSEPNPALPPGVTINPEKIYYRIDRVRIIEPAVTFRSSLLPGGKLTLHVKNLEINNIGSAPNTETTLEVIFKLFLELLGEEAVDAEGDQLPKDLRDSFNEAVRAEQGGHRSGASR